MKTSKKKHWIFCVCIECAIAVANSHADANVACGRAPECCACGACRRVRELATKDRSIICRAIPVSS